MNEGLVRALVPGKLDVIGDVHGELEALEALMRELGYRDDGSHPDERTLVFVGDLCDRGPDSVGVILRVKALIESGRAQCVLGNHELNLLLDDPKDGNGWFFAADRHHEDLDNSNYAACRTASLDERAEILAFLGSLPLILEREDLRVVHACPAPDALNAVRAAGPVDPVSFHHESEQALKQRLTELPEQEAIAAERRRYRQTWKNPEIPVEAVPHFVVSAALRQNGNPVRVLTSGQEQPAATPFLTGGKWRVLDRHRWWENHDEDIAVIFGHYWRTPAGMAQPAHKAQNLFDGHADDVWLGKRGNAFCVDHCVGARVVERANGVRDSFGSRLSAMRWPERELVMDNGRRSAANPRRPSVRHRP